MVVKWSASLPPNLTIRVRLFMQLLNNFYSVKCAWEERKNRKEAGMARFYIKNQSFLQNARCTSRIYFYEIIFVGWFGEVKNNLIRTWLTKYFFLLKRIEWNKSKLTRQWKNKIDVGRWQKDAIKCVTYLGRYYLHRRIRFTPPK